MLTWCFWSLQVFLAGCLERRTCCLSAQNAEQLLERLTQVAATEKSGAASLAVTLLKAGALEGDAGDDLLIEAHQKQHQST